jgi:hypothetical protein
MATSEVHAQLIIVIPKSSKKDDPTDSRFGSEPGKVRCVRNFSFRPIRTLPNGVDEIDRDVNAFHRFRKISSDRRGKHFNVWSPRSRVKFGWGSCEAGNVEVLRKQGGNKTPSYITGGTSYEDSWWLHNLNPMTTSQNSCRSALQATIKRGEESWVKKRS